MSILIPENKALGYYTSIEEYINRLVNRDPSQPLSDEFPLYVHFVKKLRRLFHKIVYEIQIEDFPTQTELGPKLRHILENYEPTRPIARHVFRAWNNTNNAEHFITNRIVLNEADWKDTIKNMCNFIYEYSGIATSTKIRDYTKDTPNLNSPTKKHTQPPKFSAKPINRQPSVHQEVLTPPTEREKYLGGKAAAMLPILFVLDISKSMAEDHRMEDLNKGTKWFYKAIQTDEITKDCVEMGIIAFGNEVKQELEFSGIYSQEKAIEDLKLEAVGTSTNIGQAMNFALKTLLKVKAEYSDAGLDYHQPWLVLVTDCDGQCIDDYEIAAEKTSDMINQDRLVIFPIGVGTAELKILKEFSPETPPYRMKERSFGHFFDWLKENAQFISKSRPDENVPLTEPTGWTIIKKS
jgi:uncharacterized protein YegL